MRKYVTSMLALLQTDLVSPQTKKILNERLAELNDKYEPKFFNLDQFELLRAISDRIIPQHEEKKYIELAASIDRRLAEGKNDGWRFASMPPDGESFITGLAALQEMSEIKYKKKFNSLTTSEQEMILTEIQKGNVAGNNWQKISPQHFFEELLAELTESYYSHPLAQDEIGYAGMADTGGWKNINLNNPDAHEPDEKK